MHRSVYKTVIKTMHTKFITCACLTPETIGIDTSIGVLPYYKLDMNVYCSSHVKEPHTNHTTAATFYFLYIPYRNNPNAAKPANVLKRCCFSHLATPERI